MDCNTLTRTARIKANKPIVFLLFAVFIVSSYLIAICGCAQPKISRSEFVIGTVCTVTLFENGNKQVLKDVFARLREIDNLFSVNISSSDISRINAKAGIEPVQVHKDVFELVYLSFILYHETSGAFNPVIGPIVSLWNINGNSPRVPREKEIEETLPLINLKDNLFFDDTVFSIFLNKPGMALDLGAVAKGYAADIAAEIIINAGIERAIIDLGGNIVVIGRNSGNRPWRVGIQDPNGERGKYIEVVEVGTESENKKMSIVTSGVYERFFEIDGKRYHHIFSPETGYPVDNELLSVTIILQSSAFADALSTAVFVMGYEKGTEFLNSIPGAEAVFVFKDGRIKRSAY